MNKVSNALMGLVGTAGAAAYIAALVFSGAISTLTSLPVMVMLAVVLAGLSALLIGLTPVYAFVAGGGTKEPKVKKSKKGNAGAAVGADDAFEDDAYDDEAISVGDSVMADDDFDDAFDSIADDDGSDFLSDDEISESGIARSIESDETSDDPFDISDSFESDVKEIDLAMDDSESFDDQFELSPESDIDFDADGKKS